MEVVPRPVLYVPAGQELQNFAPVPGQYFPTSHKEQALAAVLPELEEYVPASQGTMMPGVNESPLKL